MIVSRNPKQGEKIEFLSDQHTDKGPATGVIADTKVTVDGLYVTVKFADSQEQFSWDDLQEAGADVRGNLWLIKAHVKGYSRKDGVYVKPHERDTGAPAHAEPAPVHHHPKLGDDGNPVVVKNPSHPSLPSTWHNPDAVATFVPGGDTPLSINGIPLRAWKDHPRTNEGWEYVDGVNEDLWEPAFILPKGKKAASGVVIEEPDGRVWLISPTNQFGGYDASFPKGSAEDELSLQANAIKEAFEETGLKVEILDVIGDFDRTTSVARIYRARRVGGLPTAMGWETQAVHLVPKGKLYDHLNMWSDHGIAEAIGAGPAPEQQSKTAKTPVVQKNIFKHLFG